MVARELKGELAGLLPRECSKEYCYYYYYCISKQKQLYTSGSKTKETQTIKPYMNDYDFSYTFKQRWSLHFVSFLLLRKEASTQAKEPSKNSITLYTFRLFGIHTFEFRPAAKQRNVYQRKAGDSVDLSITNYTTCVLERHPISLDNIDNMDALHERDQMASNPWCYDGWFDIQRV